MKKILIAIAGVFTVGALAFGGYRCWNFNTTITNDHTIGIIEKHNTELLEDIQREEVQKSFGIKELLFIEWGHNPDFIYKKVPGANLSVTSFHVIDDSRVAFLSNSTSELIVVDSKIGNTIKKFNVEFAPRDFVYENERYYVLHERAVSVYDFDGQLTSTYPFGSKYVGVERILKVDNSIFLMLPSGNSLLIKSNKKGSEQVEFHGWMVNENYSFEAMFPSKNQYLIKLTDKEMRVIEKVYTNEKKIAGVFPIGISNNKLYIDVQIFVKEIPISVERRLIGIQINENELGKVILNQRIPDCYYVLSNKDFEVGYDGEIYQMITSPKGIHVFSFSKMDKETLHKFPDWLEKIKYHFNDNLIKVD
jgi:hypothetical protein